MPGRRGRAAVVAIARNEERYVQEWIAFYASQGWDAIILYDNNSTDLTVAKAEAMRAVIDVDIHPWPRRDPHFQISAYAEAARAYRGEYDWLGFFDLDEFLVLEAEKAIGDLLTERDADSSIGVAWAIFGSSGFRQRPAGLVIENYRWRTPPQFQPNLHIKTIIRPESVTQIGNPHWFGSKTPYVDLSGRPLPVLDTALLAEFSDYQGGKLNHYFLKSKSEWADKVQRGSNGQKRELELFRHYDLNEIEDLSAVAAGAKVRELLSKVAG